MATTITLTKGKVALVDPADHELLSGWKWYLSGDGYAVRRESRKLGYRIIRMHRQILGLGHGDARDVDHINLDRLDNRQSNLRATTHSRNCMNRSRQSNNTTGFKGVFQDGRSMKFCAQIGVNGSRLKSKLYEKPEDAYAWYCEKAGQLHGQFARVA